MKADSLLANIQATQIQAAGFAALLKMFPKAVVVLNPANDTIIQANARFLKLVKKRNVVGQMLSDFKVEIVESLSVEAGTANATCVVVRAKRS